MMMREALWRGRRLKGKKMKKEKKQVEERAGEVRGRRKNCTWGNRTMTDLIVVVRVDSGDVCPVKEEDQSGRCLTHLR
jgi:hypothetical protein